MINHIYFADMSGFNFLNQHSERYSISPQLLWTLVSQADMPNSHEHDFLYLGIQQSTDSSELLWYITYDI